MMPMKTNSTTQVNKVKSTDLYRFISHSQCVGRGIFKMVASHFKARIIISPSSHAATTIPFDPHWPFWLAAMLLLRLGYTTLTALCFCLEAVFIMDAVSPEYDEF